MWPSSLPIEWMSEGTDLPNLSLPENQDALIEQVAAANPRTIVVLETGTAVMMPWIDKVGGVLEAWYAGSKGADAVANVLFGNVNPSAKLPITFPLSEARSASSGSGEAARQRRGRRRSREAGRCQADLQRALRRGIEGGVQVVRRGEQAGPLSLWLWSFLHHLSVLRFEGRAGQRAHGDASR